LEKAEIKPASEAERLAAKEARKLWGNHANNWRPIFKDLWYNSIGRLRDGVVIEDLWVDMIPGCIMISLDG